MDSISTCALKVIYNEPMRTDETYANGQHFLSIEDGILTYYFKDGLIKAQGPYVKDRMEGQWTFYKKGHILWQVGHFKAGIKNGSWTRYDANGKIEYYETFVEGKIT